jgi:hypothetical protein
VQVSQAANDESTDRSGSKRADLTTRKGSKGVLGFEYSMISLLGQSSDGSGWLTKTCPLPATRTIPFFPLSAATTEAGLARTFWMQNRETDRDLHHLSISPRGVLRD